MLVGQGRTQKANNHPNGPMTAPQDGLVPGGPVASGGEVVLTEIPPMTISTTSVRPSINPTALFCEYILVQVSQKHILTDICDSGAYCIYSTAQNHLRKDGGN